MTCGVLGGQCLPIFLPLGAVLCLNGHGQNMCPWTNPNRQIRTTSDAKMGRPIGDALRDQIDRFILYQMAIFIVSFSLYRLR
jgi:hypothetical protein